MDILTVNDQQGQYPASYYAATIGASPKIEQAEGAISCDVCIVGGGYTGLSAALHLAQSGCDVVLLEAHRIGFGASGRNGGQVGTGQRVDQDALEKSVGDAAARALWDASLASVALVKSLIATHSIDCGFVPGLIHADHRARFVGGSHDYARKLQTKYGYRDIRTLDKAEIRDLVGSDDYHGGALDMGSGHLHPLKYALGLGQAVKNAGVRLYENSRVLDVKNGQKTQVRTESATVRADHLVLACNGYLGDLNKPLARRIMPINNFIVATEPLSKGFANSLIRHNYGVADSRFVINYFRLSEDRRMLFGGGETYGYRFPKDIAALVSKPMLKIYPQLKNTKIDYAWGGTLGITRSRMPYFARTQGSILSAAGFSGHGVAMATLAGKMLADSINGQNEGFDLMASVQTSAFPGGAQMRTPLLALAMLWYSLWDRI